MAADNEKPEPRRRWYQFRLPTLLIVVTLLVIPLGWVGWELEQRRREREVIAWVEKMGGSVSSEVPVEKSWWDEWSDKLFGGKVRFVELEDSSVSDISPLVDLKSLEMLGFVHTQVSDLSPLAELKNLKLLVLISQQVTDLSPLAGLKNLETIRLRNTQVSDEQVQTLRQALPNCKIHLIAI